MEIANHQDLMSSSTVKYSLNRDNSTKPSVAPMSDNQTPSVSLNLSSTRQMSPVGRVSKVDSSGQRFYGGADKPSNPYQVQKQVASSIEIPSKGFYHDGIQIGPVLKESGSTSAVRKSMIGLDNLESLPSIGSKANGSTRVVNGLTSPHRPHQMAGINSSSNQMAAYLASAHKSPTHHVYNTGRKEFGTKSSIKTLDECKDMPVNIQELDNQREYLTSKVKNMNHDLYSAKAMVPSSASSKEGSGNKITNFTLMHPKARDSVIQQGSVDSTEDVVQNQAHRLFKNKNLSDAAVFFNSKLAATSAHPFGQGNSGITSPSKMGTTNKMIRVEAFSKKERQEFNSPRAPSQRNASKPRLIVSDNVHTESGTESPVESLSRHYMQNMSGAVVMRGGSQGPKDYSFEVNKTESSKGSPIFASRGIANSSKRRVAVGNKGFAIKPIAQVNINRSESVGINNASSLKQATSDEQLVNLGIKKASMFSFGPSGASGANTNASTNPGQGSNVASELRASKSSGNMLNSTLKKIAPSQPINFRKSIRLEWGSGQQVEKLDLSQEFQLDKVLGKGNSSTVHKAYDLRIKKTVAVKIIEKSTVKESYLRDMLQKEIDISVTLEHPSLAQLYRVLQDSARVYIVQEFCGTTSLSQYTSNRKLGEKKVRTIFQQIVQGVAYMHGKGFSHRDLKFSNILISDLGVVKIVDFGFACENLKKQRIFCGTPSYMSPELVKKKEYYSEYVDLWALGVILYKLITNEYPFGACNDKDLEKRIEQMRFMSAWAGRSQPKDLIDELLRYTPHERISAEDSLNHPWMLEN